MQITPDKMPKTKAEAIEFIGSTITQISTASENQKTLIKKLNPSINVLVLNRMTRQQAALMIESYLKNKRKSGASSCNSPQQSRRQPDDDGEGDGDGRRSQDEGAKKMNGGSALGRGGRRSSGVVLRAPLSRGTVEEYSFGFYISLTSAKVVRWGSASYPSLIWQLLTEES
ncbi:hypothetical protein Vretifemale_16794 [Volvox reticuliferus]|uniref:Uncharacterized protein n=1 Tax=Volvox reticuliferus TaxID=1737510 RepID=A0A8J4CZX4_9CHLO|nr:hypothetical protein Vretifemale_16794 [Volvox reticuliferus]